MKTIDKHNKEKEKLKKLGKHKAALELLKDTEYDENGKAITYMYSSPPHNRIFGYTESQNWIKEVNKLIEPKKVID